jgi:hypothetical protein
VSGGNLVTAGNITGANVNATAGITAGTTIVATGNITGGNLITTGDTRTGTLETTGNALIGGNLIVNGNITYINIDDLRVEDPIIILGTGPNGAPLTVDDGLDRGIFMEYYTSSNDRRPFIVISGKLYSNNHRCQWVYNNSKCIDNRTSFTFISEHHSS